MSTGNDYGGKNMYIQRTDKKVIYTFVKPESGEYEEIPDDSDVFPHIPEELPEPSPQVSDHDVLNILIGCTE